MADGSRSFNFPALPPLRGLAEAYLDQMPADMAVAA